MCNKISLKFLYDDSTQSSSLLCRDNSCYQVWRCQWQLSLRALMWAYDRWVVLWSGYSEVTYRLCISGCSQWFWHSHLASILSPVLCINSRATQCGSRVASAWSFVSGSVCWPLNITRSCTESSSQIFKYRISSNNSRPSINYPPRIITPPLTEILKIIAFLE